MFVSSIIVDQSAKSVTVNFATLAAATDRELIPGVTTQEKLQQINEMIARVGKVWHGNSNTHNTKQLQQYCAPLLQLREQLRLES